jgi:uncharacterized protein YxeA
VISCGGGKWCTRPQSSALARQVTPQETINKLPIRCSREQDERDGNPEWVLMKQIIIPLIFLILIIPSGETTIEYPRENNAPYIDVRTAYQNIDKQFIVLNSKTSENTNLSRIRRYESYLKEYDGWNANLMYKILKAESSGNPKKVNYKDKHRTCNGSYGLMQLSCEHLTDYDIWDSWDNPEENIRVAYEVWKRQGYEAWGAYTDGRYLTVK